MTEFIAVFVAGVAAGINVQPLLVFLWRRYRKARYRSKVVRQERADAERMDGGGDR